MTDEGGVDADTFCWAAGSSSRRPHVANVRVNPGISSLIRQRRLIGKHPQTPTDPEQINPPRK